MDISTGIPAVDRINSYFWEMLRRDRAIIFQRDGRLSAILSFVLVKNEQDARALYSHPYELPPLDNPQNEVVYIDKLMGETWTRAMFREVQTALLAKFPKIRYGVWFRPTRTVDRMVIFNPHERKVNLHAQLA